MDTAQAAVRDLEAMEAREQCGSESYAQRGVEKDLAAQTAGSAHGPWRMANSPAMTIAFPTAYFDSLGLPRLFDRDLAQSSEPPDADPLVRWCGRGGEVTLPPMPIDNSGNVPWFFLRRFCCCFCFCFQRLRKGPFEGPATAKPPALPEGTYTVEPSPSTQDSEFRCAFRVSFDQINAGAAGHTLASRFAQLGNRHWLRKASN